jgi:hypothetical protein
LSKSKEKKPRGRPTKYDPKYCKEIVEYFLSAELTETYTETVASAGKAIEVEKTRCADMPTFIQFSLNIDVDVDTMLEWCKKYPEFFGAYKKCKKIQEKWLMQNGLKGNVNTAFGIFTAKNVLGWRDKVEQIHTIDDIEFEDEYEEYDQETETKEI